MGYMGFGMQRWIYNQNPRKPFKNREGAGHNNIVERFFAVKGSKRKGLKKLSKEEREELIERIDGRYHNDKTGVIILLFSLVVILSMFLYFKPWKAPNNPAVSEEVENQIFQEKTERFNMMMQYGKLHFMKNDYALAIIEFSTALSLFPENEEALVFLTKSYVNDCTHNNNNCLPAKKYLKLLLKKNPDHPEYNSYLIAVEVKLSK